jgi:hypothetical protein
MTGPYYEAEIVPFPLNRVRNVDVGEVIAPPETVLQTSLQDLFEDMALIATMPTRHAPTLDATRPDDATVRYEHTRRVAHDNEATIYRTAFVTLQCTDGGVISYAYCASYYSSNWWNADQQEDLCGEYEGAGLHIYGETLTETTAQIHLKDAAAEINRRAREMRRNFMLGGAAVYL